MDSPSPAAAAVAAREPEIQYWAAYRFPFSSPNRWRNLLFGGVCMLIPIIGMMVWVGYLAEMLELKVRSAGAGPNPPTPGAGPGTPSNAPAAAAAVAAPAQVLAYGT